MFWLELFQLHSLSISEYNSGLESLLWNCQIYSNIYE